MMRGRPEFYISVPVRPGINGVHGVLRPAQAILSDRSPAPIAHRRLAIASSGLRQAVRRSGSVDPGLV